MTKKKSSENDQLTGHFQSFLFFFFVPSTLNLKNNSRRSTNKKILASLVSCSHWVHRIVYLAVKKGNILVKILLLKIFLASCCYL